MNITLSLVIGCLLFVFTAAVIAGALIHRLQLRRSRADPEQTLGGEGMSAAVGFVGGAAAFLLGVLMLASVDHYNETKTIVADEALAYSAAFDSTAGLSHPDQTRIQRDLICLMRSVATNSWAAAEGQDLTGSDNTHTWRERAFADTSAALPTTKVQENSVAQVQAALIDASKAGQQRLLGSESDLPVPLWLLVAVSIFVLTAALTALLLNHPSRLNAVIALASVLIVTMAMLWTLTAFSEPFARDGVYIPPRAVNAVMVRMQKSYPNADWGPCEILADN